MHLYLATAEVMYTALGSRLETIQSSDAWWECGEGAVGFLEQLPWGVPSLSFHKVCSVDTHCEPVSSIFHNLTISTAAAAVENTIQKDNMWKMCLLLFSLVAMPLKKDPSN